MKKILVTGAAGEVGGRVRKLLAGVYELRLSDIRQPDNIGAGEEFVAAQLSDLAQVEEAVRGVDGIIHLGGQPVEHTWDVILHSNIIGNYNVFEAARRHGVERVVFASSNQAIGYYRRNRRLGTDITVRPSSRYGLSKAFGEGLGALYADKHGLRVFCIRIGHYDAFPRDRRNLSVWIAAEDLVQLMRIGLEHPDIHFEIVYGISNNERAWYDNTRATELGYKPAHRAEDHYEQAMAGQASVVAHPVADQFMGGRHCGIEFSGDLTRSGR